jgi:hypothetical protein
VSARGPIDPLEQEIEPMRELLVATTFVLNGRQQFAHEPFQEHGIVGQMIEACGSVRHDQ